MKILLITDDFPPRTIGGPAVVALSLAVGLKKQGHDVRIITTVRNPEDAGIYIHEDLPVHAIHSNYHPRWRAYRSLYNSSTVGAFTKILKEFRPDVVHAHNIHYHLSYHALRISKKAKAQVILTAHDVMLFHYGKLTEYIDPSKKDIPENPNYHVSPWQQIWKYKRWYNPFRNVAIRWYLKHVDHVVAVSHAHSKALADNGIMATDVVYNGIETEAWQPNGISGIEFRKRYDLERRNIVLFAGRLQEQKGAVQLIQALKKVAEKNKDALLLIVGSKDAYGEKMEAYAQSLDLSHNVYFTEWLSGDSLKAAYNAADVVVFPSVCFDTFGMVNIEAMAVAKPVIATCFGGAPEIVVDGVSGSIVNPYDTEKMAEAIEEILENSTKSRMYGLAGRERVVGNFSLDIQIGKYLELYRPEGK